MEHWCQLSTHLVLVVVSHLCQMHEVIWRIDHALFEHLCQQVPFLSWLWSSWLMLYVWIMASCHLQAAHFSGLQKSSSHIWMNRRKLCELDQVSQKHRYRKCSWAQRLYLAWESQVGYYTLTSSTGRHELCICMHIVECLLISTYCSLSQVKSFAELVPQLFAIPLPKWADQPGSIRKVLWVSAPEGRLKWKSECGRVL